MTDSRTLIIGRDACKAMRNPTLWLGLLLLATLAGCSGTADGPETVQVTGKVVLDGQLVENGTVVFESPDGLDRTFGGTIEDGEFSFPSSIGRKKVRIEGYREVPGKTTLGPDGTTRVPMTEQYVPPDFNVKTTLESVVDANGENEFVYKLRTSS